MGRFSTLHGKLATALLALLLLIGALHFVSTLVTTRLYQREVDYTMNEGLARNIVAMKAERLWAADGAVNDDGAKELFHWLMVVNPTLELYLLDAEGRVLAFDAPPERVRRDRVSLQPIHQALGSSDHRPVLGDDPRSRDRQKIVSVAPVPLEGPPHGYLYAVLGGEQLDSAIARFWSSHILRLSGWSAVAALVLAAVAGVVLFRRLTRPLRSLAGRIERFERVEAPPRPESRAVENRQPPGRNPVTGDEVDHLRVAFDELRRRVREQMAEIERMALHRRDLIANVSHDLRTPIASLQGYLETLVLKEDALPEAERREYLEIALRQSQRLATLVSELFELTKLDSQEGVPDQESFALAELVQDSVQRFRLPAQEKGVELAVELPSDLPAVVGDLGLIERVLENLVENAVRFTAAGGRVSVGLGRQPEGVEVRVSDTGCGIEAAELPFIFDRFYRCQFNSAANGEGTGLGLAIAKRILDLHSSQIRVESQPGRGTTFRFALGCAPQAA